ncbi:glycosyltransferase family 2 protein [Francisella frigiditurris]|uniref:Glycosyl transferase 2 family protein n=1 Tax=Francisella frigiditurris TaxID=1542390 RepID=A0A1J0KT52_9GAMM|nr:glycosyltransferase family 2 protein [Francisella frigiditurris]APC96830.1 glycosyl transferase 2 family protein [Francisella frigiditurris]
MSENKLCIVIPVYRHGKQLGKTLENLSIYDLDIILVDDGNDSETKNIIAKLHQKFSQIIAVETLEENQGKGIAVTLGAKKAQELGYTHMLQIDADGQHNSKDIPKFIEEMNKYPEDMISGLPQYDGSIPKSRLHGRKITNFWVAIETWSLNIPEAMCGFRIYPLKSFLKLSEFKKFASRMSFDIDVLVRLYWFGVDIRFIPTKVIYPKDGYSNFAMLKDNVRISLTHTRLFFGMLLRIPMLLLRKLRK